MKFEDVKVGQYLQDPFGNVYEVLDIIGAPRYIVNLKCITFVRPVKVEFHFEFKMEGQTWWVHADREQLIDAENPVVRQIAKSLGELKQDSVIVDGFSVTCKDTTKYFRIVTSECLAGCEIAITDMKVVPKYTCLTLENTRVGLRVSTKSGEEFTVIGYDSDYVSLQYDLKFIGADGALKSAIAKILVQRHATPNTYDASYISTKDLFIIE